jgi:hypothetical protein
MGLFDDICMVTGLPISFDPVAVFLLHREGDGAPWSLLGGPILGERDGYGRLESMPHEGPEKWMVFRIVQIFSGVRPQYSYLDVWSVQEPTAEGLSSFVSFALTATRAADGSIFPKYRSGEFACAEMLASVYNAALAEVPLAAAGTTGSPELVPPMKARDVGRLSSWLIKNRVPWKPLTSAQTSEDEQVQAFLQARERWSSSKLISAAVRSFLENQEWAWGQGYL